MFMAGVKRTAPDFVAANVAACSRLRSRWLAPAHDLLTCRDCGLKTYSLPLAGRSVITVAAVNVAVCMKQIPDPVEPYRLSPDTHTLVVEGKFVLDDSDSYGVEMVF